jgi:hypothetical protein
VLVVIGRIERGEVVGLRWSHLMEALENLRKMYALLSLIVKIYVAVVLTTLVAGVIMLIAGAFKA